MATSIETRDLTVGYGGQIILTGININVEPGEMAILIGPNGSGKSTFLRTLSGTQTPIGGYIYIDGKVISLYSRRELARHLSVVLTERNGGGALTVEECAAIGRHPYTGPFGHLSTADRDIVADSLAAVGMAEKARRHIGTLSDGERQKTMIARALAQQTQVIILDEPTAFLDVAGRIDIICLLRRLADRGHAILLSTHDIAPAIARADKLMVVDPTKHRIDAGSKTSIINNGILDHAFSTSGLHFDAVKGDFV